MTLTVRNSRDSSWCQTLYKYSPGIVIGFKLQFPCIFLEYPTKLGIYLFTQLLVEISQPSELTNLN